MVTGATIHKNMLKNFMLQAGTRALSKFYVSTDIGPAFMSSLSSSKMTSPSP